MSKPADPSKTMIKVLFEFADGHTESLVGKDAETWETNVTSVLTLHQVRGFGLPEMANLQWITTPPKE